MNSGKVAQEQSNSWNKFVEFINKLGFNPLGLALLIIIAVLPTTTPYFQQEYIVRWMIMGAFLAAQSIAFDFTSGYINIVNFGFAALLGVGAYASGIFANTTPFIAVAPGLNPWITIWLGAIVAGLVGFALGILTLRLRGIFAAVMAWFLGIALMGLVNNWTALTRGPLGMNPRKFLETTNNLPYFYIIFTMMIGIYITLKLVTRSHYGLAFKAIGQNLDAARASGINPIRYLVFNFTLSAFFAGFLGGFYAHYFGSLTPSTLMHTSKTVEILAIAYIGGRGSLWGGIAVAFPFVFLIELLRTNFSDLPGLHLVIYGVLMIVIMIYYPGGLAGFYDWIKSKVQRK
ncbi:MAG: branched-chain amino acid ABC transporter permease [Anaerolineae bacterium]|jgi:branched-chain amino acid transport system permease protein|nr:branched-chain amino acid ABC transporter permease [Anaerolineae bacterium]MBT4311915.1 branched-chain amino acid ABC transporter permease [Anaerolineae bacterium]MBT7189125.1 branched-chain amino acid ABC transporter permease [Anaerolineae bacterium]MBT7601027.1 branched-chain amino acid ABC transporter permease [Anaerolineae bacterium]MBT7991295.1 branched-chain amino acid ABC transporter permease [Anaerolineae bacterium]